jgi:hypothetical protein
MIAAAPRCPQCGSWNVSVLVYGRKDGDAGNDAMKGHCHACRAKWTDEGVQ